MGMVKNKYNDNINSFFIIWHPITSRIAGSNPNAAALLEQTTVVQLWSEPAWV